MVQLALLSKSFADRVLFEEVNWQVSRRDRVGLCGPNGAGKTTILKMLAGLEEPDAGEILKPSNLDVAYLPQDGLTHAGRTLREEVSSAFQPLLDIKADMHALEARLGDPGISEVEHDEMLHRYSDLQDRFRMSDGYAIDLKVATVARGLGFAEGDLDRPTETFSGGWQMRIALAKLLLKQPHLLLLDEPTNHLDLEARNWLETHLIGYPHAILVVSHDRFFLDAVVTRITDVGLKTLTDYTGSYSKYLVERDARLARLREAKRRQDEETARVRHFIDRFRYQATKASQVQSRIKMLEKVTPIDVPPERKRIHFTFPASAKSGRMVLELRDARQAYGDNVVIRAATLHIERGDRLAIVGPNGAGKSTLMRLLAGVETPLAGTRQGGHQVVIQYFSQDEATRLDPTLTVYETLASGSPDRMVPAIRSILGGFLFSGDDVYKRVGVLSGGERTRLAVARMLIRPSNTLVLDEPTNHLDIDSKDVLLDALVDYGGTLIFVSHDRYFVERLATKIVEVGGGHVTLYPGTYEEFLWRTERAGVASAAASAGASGLTGAARNARRPKAGPAPERPRRAARASDAKSARPVGPRAPHEAAKPDAAAQREERRQERAAQTARARLTDVETQIADRERAIKEIEVSMAAPGFYDDREAARPLIDRHQVLMWEVGDLMQRWEALAAEQVGG